jgi:hypothetical protein
MWHGSCCWTGGVWRLFPTRELALVMEEQRQASERLFGDIMDCSNGPVRGADRDRAPPASSG